MGQVLLVPVPAWFDVVQRGWVLPVPVQKLPDEVQGGRVVFVPPAAGFQDEYEYPCCTVTEKTWSGAAISNVL